MSARRRRCASVLVCAAIAFAAVSGSAQAGTYVINDCPAAGNGDAGSWTIFGAPQANKGSCGAGAGDWIGPMGGAMNANTTDGVQISVPAGSGITIDQAQVWWAVPSSDSGATTFAIASTNTGTVGTAATPYRRTSTPDTFDLPSSSTYFLLADYCSNDDAGAGCTIGSGENPDLQLFGARLTLSDDRPPTATVTGGALAQATGVSGTQSLSFDAADPDSGVQIAQLLVDGHVVATSDYTARCPYADFAACPTTISDALAWDTSTVANGPHELALRIVNAAQVQAIVDDHMVTVHNPPHTPNGAPACEAAHLSMTVAGKHRRALVRYGHRVTVRGTLLCGKAPVAGATLAIGAGKASTSVSTDALGRFSYLVPRGPSRTITVRYSAFADDRKASASATARLAVLPRISLAIAPRHTVNGGTVSWHGRVLGGPYPRHGVTLLVEVREGRRWQPFDEIVAPHGRFAYRYTFLRTTDPTTYQFRVALPANGAGGYDYSPAGSNAVRVHVR